MKKPQPYVSSSIDILHHGIISVSGTSATVDLGIAHANFDVTITMMKPVPAATDFVAWKKGTKKGTFIITTSGSMDVSFMAIARASVA